MSRPWNYFGETARAIGRRLGLASSTPKPPLGAMVKSQYGPGALSSWSRIADARWLGERSPANVQPWQRKLMRKDSQVSLGLAALKSPFFGIDYFLKGGSKQARAFLQKTMFEAPWWNSLLWSIGLTAIASAGMAAPERIQFSKSATISPGSGLPGGIRRSL